MSPTDRECVEDYRKGTIVHVGKTLAAFDRELARIDGGAAKLAEALREIGRNARYSPGPSCMWCHRLLDDHDSDCPTNIARAALAGNGTGEGAT